MAITNSIENLRSKSATEKRHKSSQSGGEKEENKDQKPKDQRDLRSESLNVRSLSPLFARKTSIDTLMAPISTSPLKEGLERGRGRSYTAGPGEILRAQPVAPLERRNGKEQVKSSNEEKNKLQKGGRGEKEHEQSIVESKEEIRTPRRSIPAKRRSLSEQHPPSRHHPMRHSLTPPSGVDKYLTKGHRRSSSNIVSRTWRQEIYDSVCTPSQLEHRADSDICE